MGTSNFPTSQDNSSTLPNPTTGSKTNSPSHGALHTAENDAIKAFEAKVGTGATTPAANNVLLGTGVGTSVWGQLSSSQWASVLTDETGTGFSVFNTSPTLVTPKVDTINESTSGNGVTVAGLSIKNGVLNSNNSVQTSNITNGSVTPDKTSLAMRTATTAASSTTTSTSFGNLADAVNTSVTVTIGTNLAALVIITCESFNNTTNDFCYVGFTASGANTIAASITQSLVSKNSAGVNDLLVSAVFPLTGLTAGSTTFKLQYQVSAGTGTFTLRTITVVPL